MKIVSRALQVIIFHTLLCGALTRGQVNSTDLQNMEKFYLSYFQSIQSVSCEGIVEGRAATGSVQDTTFEKIANIQYGMKGDKLFFDYIQNNSLGKITWSERYTYDGKVASDFFRHDNRKLAVYHDKFACLSMDMENLMLEPFSFVFGKRYARSGFALTLQDFKSVEEWKNMVENAKILQPEKIDGTQCLVIEVPGGIHPRVHQPFIVKAWLNASIGYYPVQWQRISMSGSLIEQYKVTSIGWLDNAKKLCYPKTAEILTFDSDGKMNGKGRITTSNVKFNSDIGDKEFVIEPILANTIYDAAAKTWIDHSRQPK